MPQTSLPSPYLVQTIASNLVKRNHQVIATKRGAGGVLVAPKTRFGDVIRDVGHAFHTTGNNDIGLFKPCKLQKTTPKHNRMPIENMQHLPQRDGLRRRHDGFHARRAHFVDRVADGLIGQSCKLGSLSRGGLADTRGHNVAHDHFVNVLVFDAGASNGGLDNRSAKLSCRESSKTSVEEADGCSYLVTAPH
jgi:hypothetical protein